MKTIIHKVKFKASPKELFNLFLDSKQHSQATGSKATVSSKIGGSFSASDGYIRGKNLAIIPGRMITQAWRTSEFKDSDHDSILVLTFEKAPGGTLLTMAHTAVPDHKAPDFNTGWKKHYWNPIKKHLAKAKK
jgi:activator of HSP90 ATPase